MPVIGLRETIENIQLHKDFKMYCVRNNISIQEAIRRLMAYCLAYDLMNDDRAEEKLLDYIKS